MGHVNRTKTNVVTYSAQCVIYNICSVQQARPYCLTLFAECTVFISNRSRGQTSFVAIEAGSLIEAGGRSKGEYTARLVGLPGISLCSNKYKTNNLDVLNTCSSVNRVVLIEAGL